jgi:hypothetical protein
MCLKKWLNCFVALSVLALLCGCGHGPNSTMTPPPQSNSVFVTGTDAPLPSVVSFQGGHYGIERLGRDEFGARSHQHTNRGLCPLERPADLAGR